jgi:hypothetical protein
MKTKNKTRTRQGECPACGSQERDCLSHEDDGETQSWDYECDECKCIYQEAFSYAGSYIQTEGNKI